MQCRQPRDWLHADLARGAKLLDSGSADSRDLVRNLLANWAADPDLAGLREPSAIEVLPTDERDDCLALWRAVDTVLTRARVTNQKSERSRRNAAQG